MLVGNVSAGVALALVLAAPAAAQTGRDLYLQRCATCHGANADGVAPVGPNRGANAVRGAGPSLRGVGAIAADFYLRTGYMPLQNADDEPRHKGAAYPDDEIDALVSYIGSLGGPPVPKVDPSRGDLAQGFRLFADNCSGCHQVVGRGGIVTSAVAPELTKATPTQIAEAVRVGPYLMPRFSRQQLDDRELASIVRYVEYAKDPKDEGGWGIGHLGPVPEGLVAWLVAGAALVLVARMIGSKTE
jgi:ubiquinol-cytochrome c reductase cytochrome c subunit